ncbi:MAG: hypothetical protein ACOX7W_08840 [Christensenellales bacterium]
MKPIKWVFGLLAALLLYGCTGIQPDNAQTPVPQDTMDVLPIPDITINPMADGSTQSPAGQDALTELTALLPKQIGYVWMYEGFVEYSHEMKLDMIQTTSQAVCYRISGMVGDLSDGESKRDYSLSILYTVDPEKWIQQAQGEMLMDSDFPCLEIARAPLSEGKEWTQTVARADGQPVQLVCTVESVVDGGDGVRVYTIVYRQKGSPYYERRQIGLGRGVISFEKLYIPESGEAFTMGYHSYIQPQPEATPAPTPTLPAASREAEIAPWLPPLDVELRFFGLAEYGHIGHFFREWAIDIEAVYRFNGVYNDGVGTSDKFSVRYFADYQRGTVTEQVLSNERTGKAEVNSLIHNLVALKFPLSEGQTWHWDAYVLGKRRGVEAKVIQLTDSLVTVRYSVEGVKGYYENTYFEERTFEKGHGMTGFSMLMPGEPKLTAEEARDPTKVRDALLNQLMFGYSQDKEWTRQR